MTRETENAVLLLVGISTGLVAVTGDYTRYVKPSLLIWLAAAAVLMIALALIAIGRDVRHGSAYAPDEQGHGHGHSSRAIWLLVVPIAMLAFVVPPAIQPQAAGPAVAQASGDVQRRAFPPLPDEPAPIVALPDVLMRIQQDSAGTLDGRTITLTGFTMKGDGGRTDLARVVIICCAADARLARIHLDGPGVDALADRPEDTWLSVEGRIPTGQRNSDGMAIPTMAVDRVTPITPPANPYAY